MSKLTFDHVDDVTICHFIDNNGRYYSGTAKCHPQDKDFYTQLGGEIISSKRVATKVYKAELKALQRELRVLNNLLYTFSIGEKYANEIGSQMFRQVKRARNLKQAEIWAVRGLIKDNEGDLADYINEKEHFYQEMRKMREHKAGQN